MQLLDMVRLICEQICVCQQKTDMKKVQILKMYETEYDEQ